MADGGDDAIEILSSPNRMNFWKNPIKIVADFCIRDDYLAQI